MPPPTLRLGIAGCGRAARAHLERLRAVEAVRIVGCADPDLDAARALAEHAGGDEPAAAFPDHQELLAQARPDALAVFTPHRSHYRPAIDALQAGCHVFIEKPLSTNAQEAVDIVSLARGRGLQVGVGHQYRLRPALVEARRRLAEGAIGPVRLVVATLAAPWLAEHQGPEDSWRLDPKVSGGGLLADAGNHLLDALLWTTGQAVVEVAAFQNYRAAGLDTVTAAALRLADGTPAVVGLSGVCSEALFELTYHGESGRLRTTDQALEEGSGGTWHDPTGSENIDANFVAAVHGGASLCCPADQALETVRLLEAIARSAATGQVVRLA